MTRVSFACNARRVLVAWLLMFAMILQTAPLAAAPRRTVVSVNEAVLDSFTISSGTLYTNQSGTGTVGLDAAAPVGGLTVSLSSSSSSVTIPATVTVAEGNTTASFNIARAASAAPGTATITATAGAASRTATLSLVDGPTLSGITLVPTSLTGGNAVQATVTLAAAAPAGGAAIAISSDASVATVPATVTLNEGETSKTFSISTTPVAVTTLATITGSYGGTVTATLTVTPPRLSSVTVSPSTISGGHAATGTVILDSSATAAVTAALTTSDSQKATAPTAVTIPAGSSSAAFSVSTSNAVTASSPVSISATADGITESTTLTVTPCTPDVAPPPTIPAGDTVWIDDSLPAGASQSGPIGFTTDQAASGTKSLAASGTSGSNYYTQITSLSLPVAIGENAVLYLRVNECARPREVRVRWYGPFGNYGTAFWGQSLIGGEAQAISMGAVPTTSDWVRVEIPLSQLKLEQTSITRIDLDYSDGQAWFDHLGKSGTACIPATAAQPTIPAGDTVWIDDSLPAGAAQDGPMMFDSHQAASGTKSLAANYSGAYNYYGHYSNLSLPVAIGENAVFYFRVNECARPREIRARWYNPNGTAGTIYWGQSVLGGESQAINMGAVPTTTDWLRVEIPLSQLRLEQTTISMIWFDYVDGQAWFDHIGKSGTACIPAAAAQPTMPAGDTVWIDDSLPSGAVQDGPIVFDTHQAASGTKSLAASYSGAYNYYGQYSNLNLPVAIGEKALFYLRVNECARPREVRARWYDQNGTYGTVYWGRRNGGPIWQRTAISCSKRPVTFSVRRQRWYLTRSVLV